MSTTSSQKKFVVVFTKRMNKSYAVVVQPPIAWLNPRGLHVETDMPGLIGHAYELNMHSRQVSILGLNVAVTYRVNGITNQGNPAHLTVYYGPSEQAKRY
jgi:hypothetical protein